jgi:hypothetical protein
MEKMLSEYGMQIKAFLHYTIKHLCELEFAIRVVIEVCIIYIIIRIALKICFKLILKIFSVFHCLEHWLILPLVVRLLEKLAYSTHNPYWQERANTIKDIHIVKNMKKSLVAKKHYAAGIICLIAVVWIIFFHYKCGEKRKTYEVFFVGEIAISKLEEWSTNTLLNIDEASIECFYHNVIEGK